MTAPSTRHVDTARRVLLALGCALFAPMLQSQPLADGVAACITCHGPQGRSASSEIPHLAGQQRTYLANQLTSFRSGERKNPLMQAIATQLSAEDIEALAIYWSRQPAIGQAGADAVAPPTHPPQRMQTTSAGASAALPSEMRLPADFPAGFTAYDQALDVATGVLTVRYANDAALQAARAGRPLPTGAVVMSAEHSLVLSADGQPAKDAQDRWLAGALRSTAGMEMRQGWGQQVPALLRNGDWHYGLWSASGESRLRSSHAQCLACHKPEAARQFIFTFEALAKPNPVRR